MEMLGCLSSTLIGLSLGLLGAGGSILTVPVLVYLFKLEPGLAIRYSLFIVGITSLASCVPRIRRGEVLLLHAIGFAIISMVVVVVTRSIILPLLPQIIYQSAHITLSYATLGMILFSILMIFASRSMIQSSVEKSRAISNYKKPQLTFVICAIGIGLITGLLGAGGGFLIIPVLVNFFNLDIKKAVGTSLLIIALNSISGFLGTFDFAGINWLFIAKITVFAFLGCAIGHRLANRIQAKTLKRSFGWFILVLAFIILPLQIYQMIFH